MILEIADIHIPPGQQFEFDAAIVRAVETVLARAKGYRGYEVRKGIESPERYILMIYWDTIQDHTIGFRQSELFTEWRAIIGPFFAQPPQVEHFSLLSKSEVR
jgi:heme-degrading monooxygenase HmoA